MGNAMDSGNERGDTVALINLEDYFPDWKEREALAEAMIPLIGKLYRSNVVVYCYGRALYNQSVTQLMKHHHEIFQNRSYILG